MLSTESRPSMMMRERITGKASCRLDNNSVNMKDPGEHGKFREDRKIHHHKPALRDLLRQVKIPFIMKKGVPFIKTFIAILSGSLAISVATVTSAQSAYGPKVQAKTTFYLDNTRVDTVVDLPKNELT